MSGKNSSDIETIGDLLVRHPTTIAGLSSHRHDLLQHHIFTRQGSIGFSSFTAAMFLSMSISCRSQFTDDNRFIKLSNGPKKLTDQHLGRITIVRRQFIPAGGFNHLNVTISELR